MKRCSKCLLPETYPGITFDKEGTCNYCVTYRKVEYKGEKELKKVLDSYRDREGDYDCLVAVSGGLDSSYALYYIAKVCNLRVLAYTVDNGFLSREAKLNIKNLARNLNVNLVIERSNFLKRCIRSNILSWLRKPSPATISMMCIGCKLSIDYGMYKFAKKNKIPLIITGGGGIEGESFKQKLLRVNPNRKTFTSLVFGIFFQVLRNPSYILNLPCLLIAIQELVFEFLILPSRVLKKIMYPNQKRILLFDYVRWDEGHMLSVLNKLGWKRSTYSESPWRFDCKLSFLKNYLLKETLGFTEKDDMLSNMIRENIITREEALKRVEKDNIIDKKAIVELFNELGIDLSDLSKALHKLNKLMKN